MECIETVIVGGGQAGLSMSYYLSAMGREHVVLERARVAEAWRSQRWDSLHFQGPNWSMELPGQRYAGTKPHGFAHKDEVLAFIEDYGAMIGAPVRTGVSVKCLKPAAQSGEYELLTSHGRIIARNVVVATGPYQRPRVPTCAEQLSTRVTQLHSSRYRRPDLLPDGNVLIVGTGASGCQIAEDLLDSNRRVYLSVSSHTRAPRRYRGRDVFAWRRALGNLDQTLVTSRHGRRSGPLITGAAGGHDIDLRSFAARGASLLGRATGVVKGRLVIAADLEDSLRSGDESFDAFKRAVDVYLESKRSHPGIEPDDTDMLSQKRMAKLPVVDRLDLHDEKISCVIWATGYANAFEWIALPIVNSRGEPIHHRGVSAIPGLYFLGLPWLHKAKSSFLCGVGEDAEYLAVHIGNRQRAVNTVSPSCKS